MSPPLFPALHRFPQEASIIGRLLTGYTAIEYQLCMCAGMGGGDVEKAIVELFSPPPNRIGETRRIHAANKFGGAGYTAGGLGKEFEQAICDMLWCVQIRNQFAHCIWHNYIDACELLFANMEEIAASTGPSSDTANLTFYAVDVNSLSQQEAFFFYVMDQLNYLNYRRRQLAGEDVSAHAQLRVPTPITRPQKHLVVR